MCCPNPPLYVTVKLKCFIFFSGSADEDYELDSPSSSSSDDELPDLQLQKISGLSEFKDPSSKVIPEAPRKAASSYRDILNEIFDEEIEIPERNNLGPKPWLMKPRNPRNTPLGRKTRNILNEGNLQQKFTRVI